MFKKKLIITFLSVLVNCTVFAQEYKQLPSADELKRINDSIIAEGYELYLNEKISWAATDFFLDKCENKSLSEGYVTFACGDDSISTIFYNREKKKCVFQVLFDCNTQRFDVRKDIRELDSLELSRIDRRVKAFRQIQVTNLEDGGSINKDYIFVANDVARVYCLQGVPRTNVIPFGNDVFTDFDMDGNMLNSGKCHNSYIPIELPINKKTISSITHSHLKDNPYITPSDIATFILYGVDMYHLSSFYVYSTVFGCYFKFDASTLSITVESPNDTVNNAEPFSYEKIKDYVSTRRSDYDKIRNRFENADTSLTRDEIRLVYYGFSYTDQYTGMGYSDESKIDDLVKKNKIKEAKKIVDSALSKNPVHTGLLMKAYDVYSALNDNEMCERIGWKITNLIDVILLSGAGTKEKPMYVIDVSDEYNVMYQALNVTKVKSQMLSGTCDVIKVNVHEIETEIYFDTQRSLMKMNEIFGK